VSNTPFSMRVCPECFIGHLHPKKATYVVAFGDVLLSVPNTPALKCDICHAVQFDPNVTSALEALIAQEIRLANPNTHQPSAVTTNSAPVTSVRQKSDSSTARPRRNTGRKTLL